MTARLVRPSQVPSETVKAARDCVVRDATVHLSKERENCSTCARELTADRVCSLHRRADLQPCLDCVKAFLGVVPGIIGKPPDTSLRPHLW